VREGFSTKKPALSKDNAPEERSQRGERGLEGSREGEGKVLPSKKYLWFKSGEKFINF